RHPQLGAGPRAGASAGRAGVTARESEEEPSRARPERDGEGLLEAAGAVRHPQAGLAVGDRGGREVGLLVDAVAPLLELAEDAVARHRDQVGVLERLPGGVANLE